MKSIATTFRNLRLGIPLVLGLFTANGVFAKPAIDAPQYIFPAALRDLARALGVTASFVGCVPTG